MSTELWKYHTRGWMFLVSLTSIILNAFLNLNQALSVKSEDGKVKWSFTQASNSGVMGGAASIIASDLKNVKTIAAASWSCQFKVNHSTTLQVRSEHARLCPCKSYDFKINLKCDISADSIQLCSISIIYWEMFHLNIIKQQSSNLFSYFNISPAWDTRWWWMCILYIVYPPLGGTEPLHLSWTNKYKYNRRSLWNVRP